MERTLPLFPMKTTKGALRICCRSNVSTMLNNRYVCIILRVYESIDRATNHVIPKNEFAIPSTHMKLQTHTLDGMDSMEIHPHRHRTRLTRGNPPESVFTSCHQHASSIVDPSPATTTHTIGGKNAIASGEPTERTNQRR
jgi:hypothetical protein